MMRRKVGKPSEKSGTADKSHSNSQDTTEEIEFSCKKCGTLNTQGGKKGHKKRRKFGFCLTFVILVMALTIAISATYIIQQTLQRSKFGVVEKVQDVAKQFNVTVAAPDFMQNVFNFSFGANDTRRGVYARQRGLRPKHPVVIIPGFVTTGLELWASLPCAASSFRQRMWGTYHMPQAILSNSECWVEHMQLNQSTGLDPEGVMLRASEGLAAVDFLMPGYYVWAKIIQAFADLGYDPNMLIGSTYDWRLSIANMERRDSYFSRLKGDIELLHKLKEEKVMIAAHSWGENVARNFLAWVDQQEEGWVERHVAVYMNIAGSTLGVPKAMTALLSGEMRDTAELGFLSRNTANWYLPRASRAHMFRSWGSLIGMLPQGGNKVWGNSTWAPDDNDAMRAVGATYGSFFNVLDVDNTEEQSSVRTTFRRLASSLPLIGSPDPDTMRTDPEGGGSSQNWTALPLNNAMGLLLDEGAFHTSMELHGHIGKWGAVVAPSGERQGDGWDSEAGVKFQDPLTDPLPNAPSLKMFCVYGVNKPVERSYLYLHLKDEEKIKETNAKEEVARGKGVPLQWSLATDINNASTFMENGVRKGDGDGTVPLVSLGLMCRKGWKNTKLNPGGIEIVTHELKHDAVPMYVDPRGGGKSGDHVDILGNYDLLDILLSVASGNYGEVEENIASEIDTIASKIDFD